MKELAFRIADLLGVNATFRHLNRGRIKVLLFHNVVPGGCGFPNALTPDEFEACIRHLKRCYNLIGIDQSGNWKGYRSDSVNVLLTFDDGFVNNLEVAAPILARHQLEAVFFLIADCVETGGEPVFAAKYGNQDGERTIYRTIDGAGVKELRRLGMTIGSHSLNHADYSASDTRQAEIDARESRGKLERILGEPVGLFAFPTGRYRPGQEVEMTAIYERVFLTDHGFAEPEDHVLRRNEVSSRYHLRAAASGALDFFKGAIAR